MEGVPWVPALPLTGCQGPGDRGGAAGCTASPVPGQEASGEGEATAGGGKRVQGVGE